MTTVLEVSMVMLLATTIRTAVGFGEALVAVPLLSLIIPVELAAPVAVVASIIVAGVVVARDWRHIDFKSASWLVLSTLFGIPIGLLMLKFAPEALVKGLLGGVVLMYAMFSLWNPKLFNMTGDRFAWIFGFFAGIFGGAYGLNGPPLVVYGAARGWSPTKFRATLQGYFLPASVVGMLGYGLAGLWTHEMLRLSLWSLPAIAIGILAGQAIHRRLESRLFLRLLNVGLAGIGALLLVQAFISAS